MWCIVMTHKMFEKIKSFNGTCDALSWLIFIGEDSSSIITATVEALSWLNESWRVLRESFSDNCWCTVTTHRRKSWRKIFRESFNTLRALSWLWKINHYDPCLLNTDMCTFNQERAITRYAHDSFLLAYTNHSGRQFGEAINLRSGINRKLKWSYQQTKFENSFILIEKGVPHDSVSVQCGSSMKKWNHR